MYKYNKAGKKDFLTESILFKAHLNYLGLCPTQTRLESFVLILTVIFEEADLVSDWSIRVRPNKGSPRKRSAFAAGNKRSLFRVA